MDLMKQEELKVKLNEMGKRINELMEDRRSKGFLIDDLNRNCRNLQSAIGKRTTQFHKATKAKNQAEANVNQLTATVKALNENVADIQKIHASTKANAEQYRTNASQQIKDLTEEIAEMKRSKTECW
tara:strand:- start:266 stop:646 length:381 start_codon:yes stop_codon:yes gene_type:complete